ncbi:acyl-CoA-binding domain-containing protein 5-like [Centruroides sculpturatus]|uniref:acyl-CoA-binding domain-containing protein 5-like n=1 Tax=Centruroides sculpturatus TaxID=218467 RepID=UPI000C6E236E|nr:acyl-CoA-binding domain-containing protein 5-like [Centruroides sculpturatus]
MSYTESVADFMDILGPFYEFVPLEDSEAKHNGNGSHESDEDNDIHIKQAMENSIDSLDSVTKSLKKQLKSKKCNGDLRDGGINNRQLSEAFNALKSSNGHKENGADESETDEFSDTYDQITEEENGNGILEVTNGQLDYNSNNFKDHTTLKSGKIDHVTQTRGGGDQRPSSSSGNRESGSSNGRPFRNRQNRDIGLQPHVPSPMYSSTNVNPGGNGNGEDGTIGGRHSVDVGEQLALAVIKLQHTMDEVVNRLDSLEVLLQDKQHDKNNQESSDKRLLWSLFGLSPSAAMFIVLWPFVAHWIINIMRRKRQR